MSRKYCLPIVMGLMLSCGSAGAATFTAEAEGNTITIYSSSDEKQICNLTVAFSFFYKGKRNMTKTFCQEIEIEPSNKAEACSVTHEDIVDPKIESPVTAECEYPKK